MGRKPQENPQLDMTPMIDVVFELIIFFVVTLTEAQKKDETIELETGQHGVVLTPEQLPPEHIQIDIAAVDGNGKRIMRRGKPYGRISMGDRDLTVQDVLQRVKDRREKYNRDIPVLIRADFECPHEIVKDVMDACAAAGIWRLSFMAVAEDKTKGAARPGLLTGKRAKKGK